MNYYIDEIGENVKLHTMRLFEVRQATMWDSHDDRLYADYDFPKFSESEIVKWYNFKTGKNRILISICNMDNKLIGYMTIRKKNDFLKKAEMGIVLNPSLVGNGYGTEAIMLLSKWFFERLKFRKLYLSVAMYNIRAYKSYKKLGFVPKKLIYETFENYEVDIFNDEKYEKIKRYFKKKYDTIYVKCIRMELSPKNKKYQQFIVDNVYNFN